MKKIILTLALAISSLVSYSQALGYEDLSILFSQNSNNGSSRFTAMGGAFGALGGDVSSMTINPAGISVFNGSHVSIDFQSRSTDIRALYYGNSVNTQEEYFRISNAGAVFSFDDTNNGDWTKAALGVNYRILADLDNSFFASGNSGFASFNTFPLDTNNPVIQYNNAENQRFFNNYNGDISELNLAFSGEYQGKLHVGLGLNFYDITFSQRATLRETSNDGNGNTLNARFYQENFTNGTGFSLSAGFIYKPAKSFRLGFSYQSPTWFTEMIEDSNIVNNDGFLGDTEIAVSNNTTIYDNTAGVILPSQSFVYKLRTPSRYTASAAIVFGKFGLLSLDYTVRDFRGLNLTGADFTNENRFFDAQLRNAGTLSTGTEWRFGNLSLRGGYIYEQSPDANAIDSDNRQTYSLGIGFNFRDYKVNISYRNSTRTGVYNFYPQYNQVNPAELNIDNSIVSAGVSIRL